MTEKSTAFDPIFEEKIIQAMLIDDIFAQQIMEVMDPGYFTQNHTEEFASLLKDYFEEYDAFPSTTLIPSILEKRVSNPILLKRCEDFLKKMQKNPLNGDLEYVKDKSLEFFRLQHIMSVLQQEVLPRIEEGTGRLEQIVPIIENAVNKGTDSDLGYDYIEDEEERFTEENIETIPTLWTPIDSRMRGGGFGQKRLITFLAPPGAGKSTIMCNIGKAALLQGKTIVYYTLELDWREIAEKFDASISGIEINDLVGNKQVVIKHLKSKLPEGARLIVKEYPMKQASVQTIKNHLAKLKLKGIIPHEIFIDQGGLLKSSNLKKEMRHNLSDNWIDMKGLAQYLKIPVVTVHQINRTGYNEELITLDMIAECFDIIGHSDAVITLARNLAQKKLGLGKILLGKNRQGIDGVTLAYAINGAKAMIDVFEMTEEIEELMQKQKEEAEADEKITIAERINEFLNKKKEKK